MPLLLLGTLAASYVLSCLNWVSAPGRRMRLQLVTRGGLVTLNAEAYAVDYSRGVLSARGVSLFEPAGKKLATAESLFIQLPWLGRGSEVQVRARRSDLLIERDEAGKFRFLEFLPEETKEEGKTPYTLEFSDTKATLLDHTGGSAWSRTWDSPNLLVEGVGSSFTATGEIRQTVMGGVLRGTIRQDRTEGFSAQLKASGFDLAPYFVRFKLGPEARDFPDLARLTAAEATLDGALNIDAKPGKALIVSGEGALRTKGLVYREYAFASIDFQGRANGTGANGVWRATESAGKIEATGFVDWSNGIRLRGSGTVEVAHFARLPSWIRRLAPKELDIQSGKYRGMFAYSSATDWDLDGTVTADTARWLEEPLNKIEVRARSSRKRLVAKIERGSWRGSDISGALSIDAATKEVRGYLVSPNVNLSKVGAIFGTEQLAGVSTIGATITGKVPKPILGFRARGDVRLVIRDRQIKINGYQSVATLENSKLNILQFGAEVAGGRLTGSGSVDLINKKINGTVFFGGGDLSVFDSELAGTGAAEATLSGTLSEPLANGTVELFGVTYAGSEFPFLASEMRASKHMVEATNFRGARSSARIYGNGKWNVDTDALSGQLSAQGIDLSELFGDSFAGIATVSKFDLGGTASHPTGDFKLSAQDLVAFGVKMDTGEAAGRLDGTRLLLDAAQFADGESKISATGEYDLDSETGSVKAIAEKLDIKKILPTLPEETVLGGIAGGSVEAFFASKKLARLQANGTVDTLTINPTLLGSGTWEASYANGAWTGAAQIGQIERYLEASGLRYDPEKDTVDGTFTAYGMPLKDIYLALRPNFASGGTRKTPAPFELPQAVVEKLDNLQGFLDASVTVHGDPHDPDVAIETATARELSIYGVKSGDLNLKAARNQAIWNLERFNWVNGPSRMDVTGTIAEHGEIALDGNVDNITTAWLETLFPGAANLEGEVKKLSFLVSGPTNDPVMQASMFATFFDARKNAVPQPNAAIPPKPNEDERDTRLVVNLDDVTLSNSGAKVAGSFSYLGFKGGLRGNLPFRFPFNPSEDQPIALTVDLLNRPIKDLNDLMPTIDPSRTEGEIGGRLAFSGTVKEPKVDGFLMTKNASIATKTSKTGLIHLDVNALLANDAISVSAKGEGTSGGTFDSNTRLEFKDLVADFRTLFQFAAGLVQAPPEMPFSGYMKTEALRVADELRFVPDPKSKPGRIAATTTGQIDFGGTLKEPSFTTKDPLTIFDADVRMPDEFVPGEGSYSGPIKPRFAIDFRLGSLDRPAQIVVSNGNFSVSGDGRAGGSLADPQINANFDVHDGVVRLPNARIKIEDGGTARFSYSTASGVGTGRLDIDLDGKTNLTATAFNGIVERYGINLHLSGNLLTEGELRITAQSDPPGLSEDRILALLGQGGVFESAGAQGVGNRFQQQLQSAITGVAVPYLLEPFTEKLAREMGLEYLSFEYNAYEGATVTLGKTLGKGLAIQYRRQISDPLDGRQHFEFKLTYRPIRKGRWNNIYLSIGSDEIRPWKISLEYGVRF